jgi:hypothetical protein
MRYNGMLHNIDQFYLIVWVQSAKVKWLYFFVSVAYYHTMLEYLQVEGFITVSAYPFSINISHHSPTPIRLNIRLSGGIICLQM